MKKIIFPPLAKAINTYIDLDPESKQRVSKLHGKIIAIEFLPIHLTFQCLFTENGIDILTDEALEVDTTIRGTPLQMLGVMISKENRQRFFAEDLVIEGNAELGQQVVELFDHLHIDWEEYLSKAVGDVPAYHAGNFLRKVGSWLTQSEKNLGQNINEYVHEEAKWFPSREALQDFFDEIDSLRMDVDRVEARIKNLSINL